MSAVRQNILIWNFLLDIKSHFRHTYTADLLRLAHQTRDTEFTLYIIPLSPSE